MCTRHMGMRRYASDLHIVIIDNHLSYPKHQGPKKWKSLSSIQLIGLITGSGTKTWRLWTNLRTVPILYPVISIYSDSVWSTWLARDLQHAHLKQAITSWVQTLVTDFFCARLPALLTWWAKYLSVCGAYMEDWCVPFAAHLPCVHEVKMMFLASEWLLYFLNSFRSFQINLSLCNCS
jgi:hypothetical protein